MLVFLVSKAGKILLCGKRFKKIRGGYVFSCLLQVGCNLTGGLEKSCAREMLYGGVVFLERLPHN